jgi:CRISPR type IV-associated protein Csf2
MKTMNIVMTGSITPDGSSPLATAPIRPNFEIGESEKYKEGDNNTSRLPRMARYFESLGQLAYTPYFPSAGIRGALRRAARDVLFERITNKKWSLDLHRLLTIGGVSTSGPEGDININAIQLFRDKNPLISLFGATSGPKNPWIEGKLAVGHAIPPIPIQPSIVTGVRTDPLRRKPAEITMLDEASAAALDDICNAGRNVSKLRRKIEKLNSDLKKAKKAKEEETIANIEAEIQNLTETLEEQAKLSGTSSSIQLPLSGYEAIPPGLSLNQRIVARGVNMIELGLLVSALRRFALEPLLGAHLSQGCGVVRAEWEVSVADIKGKIMLEPFIDIIVEGDDLVQLLIDAENQFNAAMKDCSEQSLMPA